MKTIGVFFYQGAGHLHLQALQKLGYLSLKIFANTDFSALDGIILPGGESSVQYDYCINNNLDKKIKEFALSKKPILGTCAGTILLSKYKSSQVNGFGLIDINIKRNYYGRQIDSKIEKTDLGNEAFMIRAPGIIECGKKVETLDTLNGNPIFVKQNNVHCTIFHPELLTFNSKNPIKQIFK